MLIKDNFDIYYSNDNKILKQEQKLELKFL